MLDKNTWNQMVSRFPKRVTNVNGNYCYLLGFLCEEYGHKKVYLQKPSWDCDWYWGFGYIKTEDSHTHWNWSIVGDPKDITSLGKIDPSNGYIYHINQNPLFITTTVTNDESWLLSEFMQTFYTLKKTAELYYTGRSNMTTPNIQYISTFKNKDEWKRINFELLPYLFDLIDKLLSPEEE